MNRLLTDEIANQVRQLFLQTLEYPVELLFFGDEKDCEYCPPTRQLVEELLTLSPKLTASFFDIQKDKEFAEEYHVDKTPGIVLAARDGDKLTDYGIRFAGIPSGHAFTSLVNDLLMVSSRSSGLNEDTLAFLQDLEEDVILQVFSTPT